MCVLFVFVCVCVCVCVCACACVCVCLRVMSVGKMDTVVAVVMQGTKWPSRAAMLEGLVT